jgi:hypothetical protein
MDRCKVLLGVLRHACTGTLSFTELHATAHYYCRGHSVRVHLTLSTLPRCVLPVVLPAGCATCLQSTQLQAGHLPSSSTLPGLHSCTALISLVMLLHIFYCLLYSLQGLLNAPEVYSFSLVLT